MGRPKGSKNKPAEAAAPATEGEALITGPSKGTIEMPVEFMAEFIGLLRSFKQAPGGSSPELERALAAVEGATKATERLSEEVKRTVRRSNEQHPGISVFGFDSRCDVCKAVARGDKSATHKDPDTGEATGPVHPKSTLKHETFFCGVRQREDSLTPLEIELFNQFDTSREAREGRWTAALTRHGTKRRLHIIVPSKGLDDLMNLPPLTQILSELLYGAEVVDPTNAMEMIKQLAARVGELEAQNAALRNAAAGG